MNLKFLSCLTLTLALSVSVQAENYAGLGIGKSWNGGHAYSDNKKHDFETLSTMWSFYAGKIIPTEWFDLRLEGEFLRMDAHAKHTRTRQVRALMANATGVIPNTGWFAEPYVGMGAGYARYDHNNTLGFQFIGGLEYDFDNYPIGTAVEYRHLWFTEDGGKNNANKSNLNSDTLMLKLKYFF